MKKLRSLFALLTVLAMVLVLAGCGGTPVETDPATTAAPTTEPTTEATTEATTEPPLTAGQVYASVGEAMLNTEATSMGMTMSYSMTYSQGEGDEAVTGEVAYDMVMDVAVSEDPFGCYVYTEIAMDMDGFSMAYDMDIYMVEEDGSVVAYMQLMDAWARMDYEMTPSEYFENDTDTDISTEGIWLGGEAPADLTMDEGTQVLDGKEVYVLHCSISAEGMDEALTSAGLEVTEDMSDMTMPVTYYVDAQTFTVLRMEAEIQFLADLMGDVMAESILGTDVEGAEFSLTMDDVIYDLGYGAQDIPAVPQEAFDYIASQETVPEETGDAAVDLTGSSTADLGNGQFVLDCGDEAVLITSLEGWSGEVYDATNVWIFDAEYTMYGDYYYLEGWTEDDLMTYAVNSDAEYLESLEALISSGESVAIDGYTTMEVLGNGEAYYYAWREIGDGYLLVYGVDYTGANDASALLPALVAAVTPYEG